MFKFKCSSDKYPKFGQTSYVRKNALCSDKCPIFGKMPYVRKNALCSEKCPMFGQMPHVRTNDALHNTDFVAAVGMLQIIKIPQRKCKGKCPNLGQGVRTRVKGKKKRILKNFITMQTISSKIYIFHKPTTYEQHV